MSSISEYLRLSLSLSADVSLSLDSLVGLRMTGFFLLNLLTIPSTLSPFSGTLGSRLNHIMLTIGTLALTLNSWVFNSTQPTKCMTLFLNCRSLLTFFCMFFFSLSSTVRFHECIYFENAHHNTDTKNYIFFLILRHSFTILLHSLILF